jgi:hypothetical protein
MFFWHFAGMELGNEMLEIVCARKHLGTKSSEEKEWRED